ncbi:ATP-dependent nuclease [Aureispira anguillae]|uniref:AAA family ATPase n=1 Tax=Aureispira anguillae TaxID=2864201 RepID=A0A915YDE4_9BACT|nr:AAA family ATPase [Aureispira anguillae]BDS10981.1 AAA family ATPase [Aureispira anguillae]
MYLANISIGNFRKIKTLELEFQKGLNLLVGENDSGKTAIIDAIKFVLGTHSNDWLRLEKDDFHFDGTNFATEMKIICVFKELSTIEAAMFLEWLSIENQEYFLKLTLRAKRIVNGNNLSKIFYDVKAGEDEESGSINKKAKDKLKVTYLKPLRDAVYELAPRKGSRLSQILANYDVFQVEDDQNHELIQIMGRANEGVENYFNDENGGKPISDIINKTYLEEFALANNKLTSRFNISHNSLGRILEKLELQGISDSGGNLGLGSNNLLFIAAEMLLLKDSNFIGLKLSLIEEIEAHLHPQSQINLINFFDKKSESIGLQSIITTHSNSLASKVDLNNLILCKEGKAFSLHTDKTKLNAGDYEFLRRFLDDTKSNLFFANGVMIVEGDAENLFLPALAEFMGYPLHKNGISIVNVGSTALLRYAKIFLRREELEELNIPVSIITDLDVKPKEYFNDNPSDIPTYYQISTEYIDGLSEEFPKLISIDFTSILEEKYTSKDNLIKDFTSLIPKELRIKTKAGKKLGELLESINIDIDQDLPTIKTNELERKNCSEKNVKYFISPNWTLEYELGLSCLRDLFYEAILTAKLILKSSDFDTADEEFIEEIRLIKLQVEQDINDWKASMSREEIAYKLYWIIMQGRDKNKVSKAVVAQCLSKIILDKKENLDELAYEELKGQILSDSNINYLVEAIKHTANV